MSVNKMDVNELLVFIENTLDWYDHVAFHFLLCRDASSALFDIEKLINTRPITNQKNDQWRRLLISQWFRSHDPLLSPDRDVLIATLFMLRQWKVLKMMAADVSTVSFRYLDQLRLILFRIVDDLDTSEVDHLVQLMELATKKQVENRLVAEAAFLFWITEQHITVRDHTILSQALQSIGRRDLVDRFISNQNYSMNKPGFCLIIQQEQSSNTGDSSLSSMFSQLGFVVQVRQFHSSPIHWKCELYRQDFRSYGCLLICFLTDKYDPASFREYVRKPFFSSLNGKAQILIFDHPVTFMENILPDAVGQNLMILWPSESLSMRSSESSTFMQDLFDVRQSGQCKTWQSAVQTLNVRYKEDDQRNIIHQIDNLHYALRFRR